jgi:hypothetical protein
MTREHGNQDANGNATRKIYPFPGPSYSLTSGESPEELVKKAVVDAFSIPEVEKHLKGIVEGVVMDAWVKSKFEESNIYDDPFDAIYLSELKPDEVHKSDVDVITKCSNIVDLSDTIAFDDEWDD